MYKSILLKISGEALKDPSGHILSPTMLTEIAKEIKQCVDLGISVSVVVGAGNIWRGAIAEKLGMARVQADYMGMLGTVINSLALQEALGKVGQSAVVLSHLEVKKITEPFVQTKALEHLANKRVVISAGGTGQPFFSTDTAAALVASSLNADCILMAKNGVDGVYSADPKQDKKAVLFKELTYTEIIEKNLKVVDKTAAALCLENKISTLVFNMSKKGNIIKAASGEQIGTLVK